MKPTLCQVHNQNGLSESLTERGSILLKTQEPVRPGTHRLNCFVHQHLHDVSKKQLEEEIMRLKILGASKTTQEKKDAKKLRAAKRKLVINGGGGIKCICGNTFQKDNGWYKKCMAKCASS